MNRREILSALPIALVSTNAAAAPEAARPLSARGEANLVAFARLVACVRFFHPSDEAAATDWDARVVANIEAVEMAQTTVQLIEALDAALRPLAAGLDLVATSGPAFRRPPLSVAAPSATQVRWSHHGVKLLSGQAPLFTSERIPAEAGRPGAWTLDLGAGVAATVPTIAPGSPSPAAAPDMAAAFRKAMTYSPSERRTRLAAVVLAWGVLEHFFPYFDVADCDWNAELSKALRAAAQEADPLQFHRTLMRMVASLHDAHANAYYRSGPNLPIAWDVVEGRLVITGLPAAGAPGLSVGGVVTRIDGVDALRRLVDLEPLVSASTPQWLRFKSLQLLQQRAGGAPATLEGEGPDGRSFKAELAPVSPTEAYQVTPRNAHANLAEPQPGVLYVDLGRLTQMDMNGAVERLAAAKGIVIDDRGYPTTGANDFLSHVVDRPVTSHINQIPIVSASDRREIRYDSAPAMRRPAQPTFPAKLVMLTGGGSISWSETCALLFRASGRGQTVGGPTAGTDGVINRIVLPGGYSIVYSGTRVLNPDGSRNQRVGVAADVVVEPTLAGIRAGRDEVLERGVALAAGEA